MEDETPISHNEINQAWEYWYPLVYGYFFRRVNSKEDVEDLTANTLSALFLKPDVQNPKGFVWQTAKNQLYKYIEQKQKNPDSLDFQDSKVEYMTAQMSYEMYPKNDEELENMRSPHYQAKIDQVIECCKNKLKEEDYKLVFFSIVENHSSTEISQKLNLKADTVRQKLKRSISKLKMHCVELWQVLKESEPVTAPN